MFLFLSVFIAENIRILRRLAVKDLNENCVFPNFDDLIERNEKFGAVFEHIPKTFLTGHDNATHACGREIENDVNDVSQPAPVHNVDNFFAP